MIQIEKEQADGAVIIRVSGAVDTDNAPILRRELHALATHGSPVIVLSLGEAEKVDTSGLATLVESAQVIGRSGGELLVTGLRARATDTYSLAQIEGAFRTFETEADALAGAG